jgi:hypothetical protein
MRAVVVSMGMLLAVGIVGCSNDASDGQDATGTVDYALAVPSLDMLDMTLDQASTTSVPVTLSGKIGDPASAAQVADYVRAHIHQALAETHDRVSALFSGTVSSPVAINGNSCKVWEADGKAEANHYRLVVCLKDESAKTYSFLLQGKPVGASTDAYLALMAGEGRSLPTYQGYARGAGKIGYNFDHLNTLLGQGPTGLVGIGYRAAGAVRQVGFGLKSFKPESGTQEVSALYRFRHVFGKGGMLRFALDADFVTKDSDGTLIGGHDGLDELGRVVVAWSALGSARSSAAICGGTVGEGKCVGLHQCWSSDDKLTAEDTSTDSSASKTDWDTSSCPKDGDLIDLAARAPLEADMTVPANGSGDVSAPNVDEPAQDAQE